jgi:site-specific DNA-methyltransferase (adenine-specific)
MITIVNRDCLEYMRGMESKSVDFVFYDPPYNAKKDYGIYKDNLDEREYKQWMTDVYLEAERISRGGVSILVGSKLTRLFFEILPQNSKLIVIHKRAVGVMMGGYFLQYVSLFSTTKPLKKTKDLWDDIRLPGEGYFFREPRFKHPGLTSLKLTERILEVFTKEGDLVFDPFSGVGTTAVACKTLGRNFIGTELNPEYIEVANQRLCQVE